ncbi:translation initiation factor IF-3, mitochondrial-like [Maniola jurtina]|uniref:translation initiation factor IF-3, mitochondrial-like n=1 Tax=Maniola jurtina TaxID=191418 RepID=UPI001E688A63|nr:translation initiation factor IF-3, mitochondrial-like [Maniola jurtina]XP_045763522.1 translation initiation factor IF-3, mitochondrial-like [Maniola jurtina]
MNKLVIFRKLFECRTISTRLTADGKDIPKKKTFENRITLIGADNSVSITDLKNAQNLSARRELKLVKVQDADSKTRRPVYKLMTNAEYHEEEISRRKEKQVARENNSTKGQKLITLSSRIAEHDLLTGVKKMAKLLEKHYEVKVVISGHENEETKSEKIYSIIEKNLKSVGQLVQKRSKGSNLRFQVQPLRDNSKQTNSDQSSPDQNSDDKGPL